MGNSTGDRRSLYYFLQQPGNLQLSQNTKLKEREVIQLGEVEASGLGRGLSCTILSHLLKAHLHFRAASGARHEGVFTGPHGDPQQEETMRASLMVQKLRLHTSKVRDPGSNPGQVTRCPN